MGVFVWNLFQTTASMHVFTTAPMQASSVIVLTRVGVAGCACCHVTDTDTDQKDTMSLT